jgi:hypothetical protein
MLCPLCRQRKARRTCPALGQSICSVCCGTKRQIEITCTSDCRYLTAARAHPASVVQKQQQRDVTLILPTLSRLTERQHQLFFMLQSLIVRHEPEGFVRLTDKDVAEAAGALAASLETAARGVVFEQTPASPLARPLLTKMREWLQDLAKESGRSFDLEAIPVLRSIERGALDTRGSTGDDTVYLALMGRLLTQTAVEPAPKTETGSGIILP